MLAHTPLAAAAAAGVVVAAAGCVAAAAAGVVVVVVVAAAAAVGGPENATQPDARRCAGSQRVRELAQRPTDAEKTLAHRQHHRHTNTDTSTQTHQRRHIDTDTTAGSEAAAAAAAAATQPRREETVPNWTPEIRRPAPTVAVACLHTETGGNVGDMSVLGLGKWSVVVAAAVAVVAVVAAAVAAAAAGLGSGHAEVVSACVRRHLCPIAKHIHSQCASTHFEIQHTQRVPRILRLRLMCFFFSFFFFAAGSIAH
eukprot:2007375-Rhodomonas_salina.1